MTDSQAGPTEETLIQRATGGDTEAFARLYEVYMERVYRHIYYRVGVVADVEDLTQEVFIRAWRSIGRYKPRKRPFLAWLYTIAHNLVIDHYRSKGREHLVRFQEAAPVAEGQQDPEMDSLLALDVVRRLLARLPSEQQQVLMLRFVEGFDYAEVAAALGKSQGAVRVIQLRALWRLRQWLEGGEGKR